MSAACARDRASPRRFPISNRMMARASQLWPRYLAAMPDARFTIEVKTHPAHPEWTASAQALADATLAVIDGAGAAERVMVEAFDWRVQRHIRSRRPDIKLAWLTSAETVRDCRFVVGRRHGAIRSRRRGGRGRPGLGTRFRNPDRGRRSGGSRPWPVRSAVDGQSTRRYAPADQLGRRRPDLRPARSGAGYLTSRLSAHFQKRLKRRQHEDGWHRA